MIKTDEVSSTMSEHILPCGHLDYGSRLVIKANGGSEIICFACEPDRLEPNDLVADLDIYQSFLHLIVQCQCGKKLYMDHWGNEFFRCFNCKAVYEIHPFIKVVGVSPRAAKDLIVYDAENLDNHKGDHQ